MEAPAPVSALRQAGIVSAGGFLVIRFADLLLGAPLVLAALVTIGGFSALVGAVLALGIGDLVAQGLADEAPRLLGLATASASAIFIGGYIAFQWGATTLTAPCRRRLGRAPWNGR